MLRRQFVQLDSATAPQRANDVPTSPQEFSGYRKPKSA
jgi:hypothetical protein